MRSIDTDATISVVVLSFDEAGKLSLLSALDRQQQKNVINFSDVELDAPLTQNTFSFEPQENWIIDDQRTQNE